jgi:L-lactate dehydrogenase complex protein LldE
MRVGLFVPCYVDQFAPSVGLASLELLESRGVEVDFPQRQGCCGQPFASAGAGDDAARLARRWLDVFEPYEHVVCPSASCVATIRRFPASLAHDPRARALAARTHELCAFLTEVLGLTTARGSFPHRVGIHGSCHALRELRQGPTTEIAGERPDPVRLLLASLAGIQLVQLERTDECCGFGGIFAVDEEAVSCRMGRDRLDDHARGGAEVVTSTDVSCLLHLDGLVRRDGRRLRVLHVAELLASAERDR